MALLYIKLIAFCHEIKTKFTNVLKFSCVDMAVVFLLSIIHNICMFSAFSLNEVLHSYAFHFLMKNNVRSSCEDRVT